MATRPGTAVHLRRAYNSSVIGRDVDAVAHARTAVDAAMGQADEALAGWLGETLATYLHSVNPVDAQAALAVAIERNRSVLRPRAGISYKKVTASGTQGQRASAFLMSRYATGAELVLGVEAVLDDIIWDKERWNSTEDALSDLGLHLGFIAQRPERDFDIGSDVMWVLEPGLHAVIEAKTGATSDKIWKADINQLAGSVNWCASAYPGAEVIPVIVHPSRLVEKSGTPPAHSRAMTKPKLTALAEKVRLFARSAAAGDAYRDATALAALLTANNLVGRSLLSAFTLAVSRE